MTRLHLVWWAAMVSWWLSSTPARAQRIEVGPPSQAPEIAVAIDAPHDGAPRDRALLAAQALELMSDYLDTPFSVMAYPRPEDARWVQLADLRRSAGSDRTASADPRILGDARARLAIERPADQTLTMTSAAVRQRLDAAGEGDAELAASILEPTRTRAAVLIGERSFGARPPALLARASLIEVGDTEPISGRVHARNLPGLLRAACEIATRHARFRRCVVPELWEHARYAEVALAASAREGALLVVSDARLVGTELSLLRDGAIGDRFWAMFAVSALDPATPVRVRLAGSDVATVLVLRDRPRLAIDVLPQGSNDRRRAIRFRATTRDENGIRPMVRSPLEPVLVVTVDGHGATRTDSDGVTVESVVHVDETPGRHVLAAELRSDRGETLAQRTYAFDVPLVLELDVVEGEGERCVRVPSDVQVAPFALPTSSTLSLRRIGERVICGSMAPFRTGPDRRLQLSRHPEAGALIELEVHLSRSSAPWYVLIAAFFASLVLTVIGARSMRAASAVSHLAFTRLASHGYRDGGRRFESVALKDGEHHVAELAPALVRSKLSVAPDPRGAIVLSDEPVVVVAPMQDPRVAIGLFAVPEGTMIVEGDLCLAVVSSDGARALESGELAPPTLASIEDARAEGLTGSVLPDLAPETFSPFITVVPFGVTLLAGLGPILLAGTPVASLFDPLASTTAFAITATAIVASAALVGAAYITKTRRMRVLRMQRVRSE